MRKTRPDTFVSPSGSPTQGRRKTRRFRLSAPVVFSWRESNGGWHKGHGVTRDIGVGGAFVAAASLPVAGAYVVLDAYLPNVSGRERERRLHAEGRVVRVEQQGAGGGGFVAEGSFELETKETDMTEQETQ